MKPLFRWAGSKRKSVKILSMYWKDSYSTYIEPFAGSATLFFYLSPGKAILADTNTDLIEAYSQVKENADDVWDELSKMHNSENEYYRIRSIKRNEMSPQERTAGFIYLNALCFNGLYRTNKKGEFNVPYGKDPSKKLPSRKDLNEYSQKLKGAQLLSKDFEVVLNRAQTNDFVYLDPPYKVNGQRIFRAYGPNDFCEEDLVRLAKSLRVLNSKGVAFLVSYIESDEASMLSNGFFCQTVSVLRNIAGFSGARKVVREVLISNIPFHNT